MKDDSTKNIEVLFIQYIDDPSDDSLNLLVQACQGLVFHYSKIYGGGYNFEDLSQSGYEGLLKAIQNYDKSFNVKFITYASHAIIGEIRHYVRRESRYYYPEYLDDYRQKMDKVIGAHIDIQDEPITIKEIADELNLKEESVLPMMSAGLVHLGHIELANIKARDMESFTLPIEDKLLLSQLMYRLNGIQRDVIELLFKHDMTQEEVARELGLTQKQVSRIKIKTLNKMAQRR